MNPFSIILLVLMLSFTSCAERIPAPRSAHSMTESFFKKYGKKYKESVFGRSPVTQVEIAQIRETARNRAQVEALVTLASGETPRVLITTQKTPPFGWKVVSWEKLE